jgi:hypothetical protein
VKCLRGEKAGRGERCFELKIYLLYLSSQLLCLSPLSVYVSPGYKGVVRQGEELVV